MLALFAKAPVPGEVKTRLVPQLSPERAAQLYEAMLGDVLEQHAAEADCELALWYAPADATDWFAERTPKSFALHPQAGPGLAERMAAAFRFHHAEGFERMVLRGTDSPTLPRARIAEGFAALEHAPVVLCPDRDGGYNLIGLREPHEGLFALEFSRASVLGATLARARELGLACELLPAHHDVDTWDDLVRLGPELDSHCTPRTRALYHDLVRR